MNRMHHDERGAALVLTLGILALITVLAVSFATLMRVEEKSSRMAVDLNKARFIAKAGLNHAIAVLRHNLSADIAANALYDSLNEEWISTFSGTALNLDGLGGNESKWIYIHADPSDDNSPIIGRYAVLIQDEAGKLHLNVGGSGDQAEGWTPYELDLGQIPNIGTTLASNILNYREGPTSVPGVNTSDPIPSGFDPGDDDDNNTPFENDSINNNGTSGIDEINEGVDSPTEFDPEIPYGDDRSFASIEELINVSGIGAAIVAAAKNYSTVWSYDVNQFWNGSNWQKKANINHLLSTGQLYNLIVADDIYRMGSNMIDYADRDDYPTLTTTNAGSPDATNSYIGLEGLQFNEVMTHVGTVLRENDEDNTGTNNDVARTGAWTFNSGSPPEDTGTDGQTADYSWPWDNGIYTITIAASTDGGVLGGLNYTLESGEPGEVNGSLNASVTIADVQIRGNAINLHLEAAADNPGIPPDPGVSYFGYIEVQAGKYIEMINISLQGIDIDKTGGDSWRLNIGGTPVVPIADGLPLTITGGTNFELSQTWNITSDITLDGRSSGGTPPSYNYLVITDSLYALDAIHRNDSGSWGDGGGEEGILLAIPVSSALNKLHDTLPNTGADLALINSNNQIIAYAPETFKFHIAGYDGSPNPNQSAQRIAPVDQTSAWYGAVNTPSILNDEQGVPKNVQGGQDRYWEIKDRPYATIGELGDVFLGTDHSETYDAEDTSNTYFDQITVAAKRLEAENADSTLSWTAETATDHDGTERRTAPSSSGSWNWSWTFDMSNPSKPFRFKNDESFDVLVYGQFGADFESPGGTSRHVKPNHGISLDSSVTVTSNAISIPITGDGVNTAKLDFVLLTPESYTWGKINVNTASREALKGLPGIGDSLAGNILSYRSSNPFDQIQEITAASGIGENTFKPISNLITVRSDVYRILVKAERIMDIDKDGDEGDADDQTTSSVSLEAVVDRNPVLRFPGTSDFYRVEFLKYNYEE